MELPRRVTSEFGQLKSMEGRSEFPDRRDGRFDEIIFVFQNGALVITAQADDDSLTLGEIDSSFVNATALDTLDPWRRLIGCSARWVWKLTNDHEYFDGVQIEFARTHEAWIVQLMCEASSLSARAVVSLDKIQNDVV